MIGQTAEHIGTFETDAGSYVYVEGHAPMASAALLAAPTGSAARRFELGPFDAVTAQLTYAALCRKYPVGMNTPAMTTLDAALL